MQKCRLGVGGQKTKNNFVNFVFASMAYSLKTMSQQKTEMI
jgi:hypothetical protein